MKVLTSLAAAAALLLLCEPAAAGAPQADRQSPARNPANVTFEHDGEHVDGFVLYISRGNETPQRVDLGRLQPDASGRFWAAMPALPPGAYRLEVAAYNAAGESARVSASPGVFEVTARQGRAADGHGNHQTAAATTQPPAPAAPSATPPEGRQQEDKRRESGLLRRIWQVVVGEQ